MGRLAGESAAYQWMNVAAAAGIGFNGWWHSALPSATLNVVWLMIGLFALWRIRASRLAQGRQA